MKLTKVFVVVAVSQISRLPLKTILCKAKYFLKIHRFLAIRPSKSYFGSELQGPCSAASLTVPPCVLHVYPHGPKRSPGPSCPLLPELQFPH